MDKEKFKKEFADFLVDKIGIDRKVATDATEKNIGKPNKPKDISLLNMLLSKGHDEKTANDAIIYHKTKQLISDIENYGNSKGNKAKKRA